MPRLLLDACQEAVSQRNFVVHRVGLEAMVGSVYAFCEDLHGVEAVMLDENYRSNATLVGFSLEAGYRRTLSPYSPDLKLHLPSPLPTDRPDDWPGSTGRPSGRRCSTQSTRPRASSTLRAGAAGGTSSRPTPRPR